MGPRLRRRPAILRFSLAKTIQEKMKSMKTMRKRTMKMTMFTRRWQAGHRASCGSQASQPASRRRTWKALRASSALGRPAAANSTRKWPVASLPSPSAAVQDRQAKWDQCLAASCRNLQVACRQPVKRIRKRKMNRRMRSRLTLAFSAVECKRNESFSVPL